jgi:hypothetical protein
MFSWKKDEYLDLYLELKNGKWKNYVESVPGENMKSGKKTNHLDFNLIKDIDHIFFQYVGEGFLSNNSNTAIDIEYIIFFRMKSKSNKILYGYLQAWHDYTGFDCRGGIKIYLSKTKEQIEKYAIPVKYFNKMF